MISGRRSAVAAAVLATAVAVVVVAERGRLDDLTPRGSSVASVVQPGRRLAVPTAAPLSAACVRAQQEEQERQAAVAATRSPAPDATATAYLEVGVPVVLPECRGQVPADPLCSGAAAQPAGAPPVPVPYEQRAQVRAAASAPGTGYRTDADGLTTLLLVVEPDAGMAQRIADVAQVPVREELGGRVVRVRFDPHDADLQLNLGALPGVWRMSVDPSSGTRILAPGQTPPADPAGADRAVLESYIASAARIHRNLQQICADRPVRP